MSVLGLATSRPTLTAAALTILVGCTGQVGGRAPTVGPRDATTTAAPDAPARAADGSVVRPDAEAPDADTGGGAPADSGPTPADSGPAPKDAGQPPLTGPRDSARVYWIGHSLVDHRDVRHDHHTFYARMLVELVGYFAESNGQAYDQYRHTTPGAPLWWNWGREPQHTNVLLSTAEDYDVLVITESIPIWITYRSFHTSFYARQFACAALRGNPNTAVYIYETWPHLHASDRTQQYPEEELYDFRAQLDADRQMYEAVTTEMRDANVTRPPDFTWSFPGTDPAVDCRIDRPVHIIPGGRALAALWDRLENPRPSDNWEGLSMAQIFQNGYVDWPSNWPVTPAEARNIDGTAVTAGLTVADPSIPMDDIHMSYIGSYYIGLVAYATIYRTSPVGLPTVDRLSDNLARHLQALAWQVVVNDPFAGVQPP